MRVVIKLSLVLYVLTTLILGAYFFLRPDTKGYAVTNLVSGLDEEQARTLKTVGFDWLDDSKAYTVNGYTVYVPNTPRGDSQSDIMVMHNENLVFSRLNTIGAQVYNPGAGCDLSDYAVNLQDWDKDGSFDSIYYSVKGPEKKDKTIVMDRNFDGALDKKTVTDSTGMHVYKALETTWVLLSGDKGNKR